MIRELTKFIEENGEGKKSYSVNQEAQNRVYSNIHGETPENKGIGNDDTDRSRYVFTDGGCINNGKANAVGGVGVYFGKDDPRNYAARQRRYKGLPSNQRGEIEAAAIALHHILRDDHMDYVICTDSNYLIDCITKHCDRWIDLGWKTCTGREIKHLDQIKPIYNAWCSTSKRIRFEHVRSHQEEPEDTDSHAHFVWAGNAQADDLATEGIKMEYDLNMIQPVLTVAEQPSEPREPELD
jgi:ribonuclease HI